MRCLGILCFAGLSQLICYAPSFDDTARPVLRAYPSLRSLYLAVAVSWMLFGRSNGLRGLSPSSVLMGDHCARVGAQHFAQTNRVKLREGLLRFQWRAQATAESHSKDVQKRTSKGDCGRTAYQEPINEYRACPLLAKSTCKDADDVVIERLLRC